VIIELNIHEYKRIKPLLQVLKLEDHPVINGVIDGNNRGRIFVDDDVKPTVALVWAKMEMIYFIGDYKNKDFNRNLELFILNIIKPEALEIGDTDFNLELYPFIGWDLFVKKNFRVLLNVGLRVPFIFDKDLFLEYLQKPIKIYPGYEIHRIDQKIIDLDQEKIIQNEILKFWESLDSFFHKGFGYCVMKDNLVIGSCISVFVSGNEFEIGINTYGKEHRGKGLASRVAREFIRECIEMEGNPHWTTEIFRKDSIAIAKKLGFIELPSYKVYYIPFFEWTE
jgi:RimJ/RimL family protein N-acetyltransferase